MKATAVLNSVGISDNVLNPGRKRSRRASVMSGASQHNGNTG